ncbi:MULTISPECIES: helix-turn-helix domain-containing protein [Niastella]|uniref:Helix-turn-helix transcriptional regulator n=1 Tax=Niastella soli TaxID=2821487 RepID=A0ABS3YYH8_9BACT|nr:helix-turn-helix transcriptional regulator [Niastella soli]MBO9202973.1 helix-turn-helix transcriptional regulator [Niastella soli]
MANLTGLSILGLFLPAAVCRLPSAVCRLPFSHCPLPIPYSSLNNYKCKRRLLSAKVGRSNKAGSIVTSKSLIWLIMNIGQQILFLVSALGAVNGIILSGYLFISKKGRSIPAFFLGLLLLAISLRVAKSVFLYFNPLLPKVCLQAGLSACFLIGPALYHFLKSSLNGVSRIPLSWKWHWGILMAILLIGGIDVPYKSFPHIWNNIIVYVIYGQWLIYLAISGSLLTPVIKNAFTRTYSLKTTEKFWLLVYGGNLFVFVVYLLALFRVIYGIYICGSLAFSFFLYLTIFFYLHSAQIENLLHPVQPPADKPEKKKIAATDAQIWSEKLEKALHDKELYKDPNLKLSDLAQTINISAHLLSQLLNDNLGKSFSTYINEYRINEACKLIKTNDLLTLEAIGYEVGFNSKSTFYTAFKKIKDTTPALFKESIAKTDYK